MEWFTQTLCDPKLGTEGNPVNWPEVDMRYVDDNYCFGCGSLNPAGFQLVFDQTEDGVKTIFHPKREHQGYRGMLHGGLMMTLLDEAMAWAVATKYKVGATAEMKVRIRKFGETNNPITVIGRTTKKRLNLVEAESFLLDQYDNIIAQATGKFMLSDVCDQLIPDDRKASSFNQNPEGQ